ncbi:DUF6263 family protein [Sphingobacterium spiritivorum]|uniref:DUF6263 family protein n=1 Tax=Sphingobacterium spiritivorum TaxID=258 RepID=UPI003692168C
MKKHALSLLILLGLALTIQAQQAVTLKIKPSLNKPSVVKMDVKTDVDGPQSVLMNMTMKMEMTPKSIEGEKITIETLTKTIKAEINADMMTLNYDSEKESTDEMGKMLSEQFAPILGKTITTVMTNSGKVLDVSFPTELGQGIDKNSFNNMATALPDHPVKPGDTWDSEIEKGELVPKITTKSTFKEISDSGYVIDIAGNVFGDDDSQIGTITGNYILDKTTNLTKSYILTTRLEVQGTKVTTEVTMNTL